MLPALHVFIKALITRIQDDEHATFLDKRNVVKMGHVLRLWPLPPLPKPLGAWSHPMVLSHLDTKLVCLFYIAEPIAAASLGGPTGTPTGSEKLEKEKRDLDRQHRHLANALCSKERESDEWHEVRCEVVPMGQPPGFCRRNILNFLARVTFSSCEC